MAVKTTPGILEKTKRFKEIRHEGGKFLIWGNPAFIDPIYLQLYYHKLVENACGNDANRIRYYVAKTQAIIGSRIISERFGYAKTIPDKKRLMDFLRGQTDILGLGHFENVRVDFKNNLFIYKTRSPYAEEYKRFFGFQKHPVDYWLMGMWAGAFENLINRKMLCLEINCIAAKSHWCEFVIKPVESWDKKSPEFKHNKFLLKETKTLEELGAKIPPYLGLPKHV